MPSHNGFVRGAWLADCDTCGLTYLAYKLINDGEMSGLKVCPRCWDMKHPQEIIRPVIDEQPPSWTRPEPPWEFINTPATEDNFSLNSYMFGGQLMDNMANITFKNFCAGVLTGPLSTTATTIPFVLVNNAQNFQTVSNPLYFYATIIDNASYAAGISPPNKYEIVKVTTYAGSGAFTVTRAQDGTTAQTWAIGDRIEERVTAASITDATGASGAPTTAQYLTLALDATLTAERVLTMGSLLAGVDGGANSTYTMNLANAPANSMLGNNTAGSALPTYLTTAQVVGLISAITNLGGASSIGVGADVGKPAASLVGRLWVAADTGILYRDTGVAWANVTPTFTGDVTKTVGSLATTIAAAAVTNAKMANMAASTVKGSIAGGTPIDLTTTQLTTLINTFSAALSGAVPASGGGTTNFLRADGSWAAPSGGGGGGSTNQQVIINGGMLVAQRIGGTTGTVALSTAAQYGLDRWAAWFSSGSAVSGTMAQTTASTAGRTGYALALTALNAGGATVMSMRTRIESKDAIRLKNATASFSCVLYQTTGSTQTATVLVRKANATDNFGGGVTLIGSTTGSITSGGTGATLTFNSISMGDCSTGIEIEVQMPIGTAPVGLVVHMTEAVLGEGTSATFPYQEFEDEYVRAMRYYQKSFPYTTVPVISGGQAGSINGIAGKAGATAQLIWCTYTVPLWAGVNNPSLYNPVGANTFPYDFTFGGNCAAAAITSRSEKGFLLTFSGNASTAVGNSLGVHYTIDQELP